MEQPMPDPRLINAGPTKAFFVRMLTRDIELADSILDLLDNCVDGVVRELKQKGEQASNGKPYKGYWAHITATPDSFDIIDNCGGIPEDIAERSAFMLGRPDTQRDADIETVGMYGIGMKRAMFKMGRHSLVVSQPESGPYKVEIPPEWLEEEAQNEESTEPHDPWKLRLEPLTEGLDEDGTKITIMQLHDEISRQFDSQESPFLSDLEKEIARHYALILQKGFSVSLNGRDIKPVSLSLLCPTEVGSDEGPSVEPYILTGEVNGVQVELAVGFYRPLATEAELDDEEFVKSKSENAGWTVICNDRVVLYNDKTFKTGWGTKGVTPGYHNQFISIRGIVSFRSKDSMSLPLNTTKRGLATDSALYQAVIDHMRNGLKYFTSFTNRWKKQEEETTHLFEQLSQRSLPQIVSKVPPQRFAALRSQPGLRHYAPELPKPEPQQKQRRICFAADQRDVEVVAEFYFDDAQHDRAEVGRRCFDESLKRARRGKT
jgi:hypothetical protein